MAQLFNPPNPHETQTYPLPRVLPAAYANGTRPMDRYRPCQLGRQHRKHDQRDRHRLQNGEQHLEGVSNTREVPPFDTYSFRSVDIPVGANNHLPLRKDAWGHSINLVHLQTVR